MSSIKIGFFLMVIVVSVVSYYFTNLVNPIPKPNTADTPKDTAARTVASVDDNEEEIEENGVKSKMLVLFSKDKGFRYDLSTRRCMNKLKVVGSSPKFVGECGDLTKLKKKKIGKLDFKQKNLRGIQLAGLDLSKANFVNSDLTGANLRDTNLKTANLDGTILTLVEYSDKTVLPFSFDIARARGMVRDGEVVTIPIPSSTPLPTVIIPRVTYIPITSIYKNPGDILINDPDEVLKNLRGIVSRTEKYHNELLEIVKKAESIDSAHLLMVLKAIYLSFDDYSILVKQYEDENISNREREELGKEISHAREFGIFANTIADMAMGKVSDFSFESAIKILGQLYETDSAGNTAFTILLDKNLKQDEVQALLDLAQKKQVSGAIGKIAVHFFNNFTDKSVASAVELAKTISDYDGRNFLLESVLAGIKPLGFEDAFALIKVSKSNNSLVQKFIGEIASFSVEQAIQLANITTYSTKDFVTLHYMNVRASSITTKDLISLSNAAYDNKTNIRLKYFAKISDWSIDNAILLSGSEVYSPKDTIISYYLGTLKEIKTADIIRLSNAAYDMKSSLRLKNLDKISDFTLNNAIVLAGVEVYSAKDTIMNYYMTKKVETIAAADLIRLSNAAYDMKSSLRLNNFAKILDWSVDTAVLLASVEVYSSKDTVISYFLTNKVQTISTADLLKVTNAAYDLKTTLRSKNWDKISDWSIANLGIMANYEVYSAKDTLVEYYLSKKMPTMTMAELITVSNLAYDKKDTFKMSYFPKVSDKSVDTVVILVRQLVYSNKDTIILSFLNTYYPIPSTTDILTLAAEAYEAKSKIKLSYLGKINDFNLNNAIRIAKTLTYSEKNTVINFYINGVGVTVTGSELISLADNTYDIRYSFVSSNLKKIVNFKVSEAISMANSFAYGDKDNILKLSVVLVVDLSAESLQQMANAAYDANAKNQIYTLGLPRINH